MCYIPVLFCVTLKESITVKFLCKPKKAIQEGKHDRKLMY